MISAYEAWQNHEPHPDDELYEKIWRGQAKGWSQEDVEERIAKQRVVIDCLETGKPLPPGIVSARQPNGDADPTLQLSSARRSLNEFEEAYRSHGRSLSMNQNHVARMRIDQGGSTGCDDGGGTAGKGLNRFR